MISGTLDLSNSIKMAMTSSMEGRLPVTQRRRNAMVRLGVKLGRDLLRRLGESESESALSALERFWSEGGLGRMRIRVRDGVVVELRDCYDCSAWKVGLLVWSCEFKASILSTVIGEATWSALQLEEVECCRETGGSCVFRSRPT